MTAASDAGLRRSARCLAAIAHVLESVDDAFDRVEQALVLMRDLVPYARCALLYKDDGDGAPDLLVVPREGEDTRAALLPRLQRILRILEADDLDQAPDEAPRHLALPLMGLDHVIGVLRVDPPSGGAYDVEDVRYLSIVAAQLGAYLTIIRLREDEARQARDVKQAHDFQQRLVGVVSHDLRNPLSVIIMAARHALAGTTDAKQAKGLERVLRNSEKAERLIGDLLDVTHARVAGEMSVTRQRADLVPVLRALVEDVRLVHAAVELVTSLHDAFGEWDVGRLGQVASNLISNAVHHGARGEVVRVELTGEDGELRLSVHNVGDPIPEALRAIIFDPFKQGVADGRRTKGGGLGLGLYIADQVVRAHGGRIAVESGATGTTFVVTLPCDGAPPPR